MNEVPLGHQGLSRRALRYVSTNLSAGSMVTQNFQSVSARFHLPDPSRMKYTLRENVWKISLRGWNS